jgi:hypothetical protein
MSDQHATVMDALPIREPPLTARIAMIVPIAVRVQQVMENRETDVPACPLVQVAPAFAPVAAMSVPVVRAIAGLVVRAN